MQYGKETIELAIDFTLADGTKEEKEVKFDVEFPQPATIQEQIEYYKGEQILNNSVNVVNRRRALQAVNKFNKEPEGGWNEKNVQETIQKVQAAARGAEPDTGGIGVKAKADNVDKAAQLAELNAEAFARISALDFLAFTKGDLSEAQLREKYNF